MNLEEYLDMLQKMAAREKELNAPYTPPQKRRGKTEPPATTPDQTPDQRA